LPTYEAILFDFDGVLVDSEPVHYTCWRETLAPFGIDFAWETYQQRCIGITDRAMLEELCRLSDPPLDIERLWQEYPAKRARFRQRMLSGTPVALEVKALLDELSVYRLAVVSSSGRAEVEPILEAGGIRHYFDAVVCREDVSRYKPDPDPYQKAAELLRATSALVVEDSEAGIASGRAAGFDVLEVRAASEMPSLVRAYLGK
jgi:beta-phosphoglucomutase